MADRRWTASRVAHRLEDAAATMQRLPPVRVQGYVSSWPPIVREYWDAFGWDEMKVRLGPPSAVAIDQMDEAFVWLHWLEPDAARIAWLRACKMPWKALTMRMGMGRTRAWQEWVAALQTIAVRVGKAPESGDIHLKGMGKAANKKVLNNANKI